jgi:hypothetical protein
MTLCTIVNAVLLTIRTPDGSEVVVPSSCAWLLTRPMPPMPMKSVHTGEFIEHVAKSGKPYKRPVFASAPDPESLGHLIRVATGGWRFWREGKEVHGEPVHVVALPLRRDKEAA